MRLITLSVLAALWCGTAWGITATAPYKPTLEHFADGEPHFFTRAFQAELSVEWNGVEQYPLIVRSDLLVEYSADIFRHTADVTTMAIGNWTAMPAAGSYGPTDYSANLFNSGSKIVIGIGFEERWTNSQIVDDLTLDILETWDEPATVGDVRRSRHGRLLRQGYQTWELTDIQGPWENTSLILFDDYVSPSPTRTDHFLVTLDRFGWLPVDELVVGAPTRRALRRANGVAAAAAGVAAVPEPGAILLAALAVCCLAARRARMPFLS